MVPSGRGPTLSRKFPPRLATSTNVLMRDCVDLKSRSLALYAHVLLIVIHVSQSRNCSGGGVVKLSSSVVFRFVAVFLTGIDLGIVCFGVSYSPGVPMRLLINVAGCKRLMSSTTFFPSYFC